MLLLPRKELQDTFIFSSTKDHELILHLLVVVTEAIYVYEGNLETTDKHKKKGKKSIIAPIRILLTS